MADIPAAFRAHLLKHGAAELMKANPLLVALSHAGRLDGGHYALVTTFTWGGGLVVKDKRTGQALAHSHPLGEFRLWLPPGVVR